MLRESKPKFTRGFSSLVWSGAISKLFFPFFFCIIDTVNPLGNRKDQPLTVQQEMTGQMFYFLWNYPLSQKVIPQRVYVTFCFQSSILIGLIHLILPPFPLLFMCQVCSTRKFSKRERRLEEKSSKKSILPINYRQPKPISQYGKKRVT